MNTLLVLSVLAVTFTVTYGLKCFTCEGEDSFVASGSCGDAYDSVASSKMLRVCNATAGENWCKKSKIGANEVYTKVTRGCASQCEPQNLLYIKRTTCCNNTDGCNSAGALTSTLTVMAATVVCSIFIIRK